MELDKWPQKAIAAWHFVVDKPIFAEQTRATHAYEKDTEGSIVAFLRARLLAKASMSFSPERRKSRKSSPLYLHVWQILKRIK